MTASRIRNAAFSFVGEIKQKQFRGHARQRASLKLNPRQQRIWTQPCGACSPRHLTVTLCTVCFRTRVALFVAQRFRDLFCAEMREKPEVCSRRAVCHVVFGRRSLYPDVCVELQRLLPNRMHQRILVWLNHLPFFATASAA